MKSLLLRSLVLAAVLATRASAAAPFQPFVLPLAPGSSPTTVQKALGLPSATLGPDLWVYFDFAGPNPNAANPAFDTLVIAFTDRRVTAVKITDGRVVRQLLAQHRSPPAQTSVAAK